MPQPTTTQAQATTPLTPSLECPLCGGEGHSSPTGELCPCDECGHGASSHYWAPALPRAASELVYATATCWAENVCRECSPERAANVALVLASLDEYRSPRPMA
jgi:hypothetical protein